jgi:hypothetical protein
MKALGYMTNVVMPTDDIFFKLKKEVSYCELGLQYL